MAVEEVFVVKANTGADAESFLELAQAHLESQKNIFEGYGTDQMALLGEASVESVDTMSGISAVPMPDNFVRPFYPDIGEFDYGI